MKPVVHLICGPVGSGKTTYSRKLASEHNAIVFSMDEWMQNIFGADLPKESDMAKVDFAWFSERVDRCEVQIWTVASQLLNRGQNVILDLGFIRKARRDKARGTASGFGFQYQLHVVDADLGTRRDRVSIRNYEAPDEVESEHAITFHS